MRATFVLLTLMLTAAASSFAAGPGDTPSTTRQLRNTVGASVNNAGLQNQMELTWRTPTTASENPLMRDAHIAFGVTNAVSPSYARGGAWFEVAPASVAALRVGVEPTAYFGTFNSLMPFASASAPFDNDSRDARTGEAGRGAAVRLYASPTLRFKAGPVAAQSSLDLEWWRASAGPYFYEPGRDTLLRSSGGRLAAGTTALMLQRERGDHRTSVGMLHRLLRVADAPQNRATQLGVLVSREYQAHRFGLSRPSVVLAVGKYLDHPSRAHQTTASLGISFDLQSPRASRAAR